MAITSGTAKEKFGDALKADLQGIHDRLVEIRKDMDDLEEVARGVNGLSTFLRNQVKATDMSIEGFVGEIDDVPNKIAGLKAKKEPITERVSDALAQDVVDVRAQHAQGGQLGEG
jgi:hypothetical protein